MKLVKILAPFRDVEIKLRRKRTLNEFRIITVKVPEAAAHEFAGPTPTEEDWVMAAENLASTQMSPGNWTQERDTFEQIEALEGELIAITPPLSEPPKRLA